MWLDDEDQYSRTSYPLHPHDGLLRVDFPTRRVSQSVAGPDHNRAKVDVPAMSQGAECGGDRGDYDTRYRRGHMPHVHASPPCERQVRQIHSPDYPWAQGR